MRAKIETAERDKGRILTSMERATLLSDSYSKLKKLAEEYVDVETGNKLTQDVASYAIKTIKEKSNKKETSNQQLTLGFN